MIGYAWSQSASRRIASLVHAWFSVNDAPSSNYFMHETWWQCIPWLQFWHMKSTLKPVS